MSDAISQLGARMADGAMRTFLDTLPMSAKDLTIAQCDAATMAMRREALPAFDRMRERGKDRSTDLAFGDLAETLLRRACSEMANAGLRAIGIERHDVEVSA